MEPTRRPRDKHGCAVEAQFVPLVAGVFFALRRRNRILRNHRGNNEKIDDVLSDQLNGLGVDEMIELSALEIVALTSAGMAAITSSALLVP